MRITRASRRPRGFSLLEIMLAALVLLMGLMAVTQLSKGLLSSLSPSQAQGPNQHPAIVENLLRDQIEQARNAATHVDVTGVGDLVTPHGTYRTSVALANPPIVAAQSVGVTMLRRRYVATVRYQAVGAAAPGVIAGQVVFDKLTGRAGRSGL